MHGVDLSLRNQRSTLFFAFFPSVSVHAGQGNLRMRKTGQTESGERARNLLLRGREALARCRGGEP